MTKMIKSEMVDRMVDIDVILTQYNVTIKNVITILLL